MDKFLSTKIFDELDAINSTDYFYEYAIEKNGLSKISDTSRNLVILSSEKGSGKTALFKLATRKMKEENQKSNHVLSIFAPDLDNLEPQNTIEEWSKAWKASILREVFLSITKTINIALTTDDAKAIDYNIEECTRKEGVIQYFLNRLKSKQISWENQTSKETYFFERYIQKNGKTFLFIDEIDMYYSGSPNYLDKIAGFFSAIRDLTRLIPDLKIRVSIKPDTLSVLKVNYAFFSNFYQDLVKLEWNSDELLNILNSRVQAYLENTYPGAETLDLNSIYNSQDFISLILNTTNPWDLGSGSREPHLVLSSLSHYRPRWLLELCITATETALKKKKRKISFEDVKTSMKEMGNNRILDLAAEYQTLCPTLDKVIASFYGQPSIFLNTSKLQFFIENYILKNSSVKFQENSSRPTWINILNILYQIGFIQPKYKPQGRRYHHIKFKDEPRLLDGNFERAFSYKWEIHPIFRNALNIIPAKKIDHKQLEIFDLDPTFHPYKKPLGPKSRKRKKRN